MGVSRVGVIGGGQLAWMMAQVAPALEIELVVQTPSKNDPAVSLASDVIFAAVDDAEATAKLASICDVITFENEFVSIDALQHLAEKGACFRPSLASLAPLLDKYHQRRFLRAIGLPVPEFREYNPNSDRLAEAVPQFPSVIKARRHGYDGQGTIIIHSQGELESNLPNFQGIPLLLEEYVPFERELAVIAARNAAGQIVIYPVVETHQQNQVCHWVIAPATLQPDREEEIRAIARTLLTKLDYVGVLGIELFLTAGGKILINEVAPRTHNSGHYTLDACPVSQFAMQLRAIADLPLEEPALKSQGAVMVNLLGYEKSAKDYWHERQQLQAIPNTHLHWYGKSESRIGRKLGHVTVLFNSDARQDCHLQGKVIAEKIETIWYQKNSKKSF